MTSGAFYIGMDVGGTTFKALAVTPEGRILGRAHRLTEARRGAKVVIGRMVETIRRLEAEVSTPELTLAAVGFGIAGILDLPAGIVRRSPNLPGWEGTNVRELVGHHLPVPFTIDNDADAAVLGEAWLGAGRGMQHVVMVTLGTGVGGGVLINNTMLHGAQGYGGEVGHTVVDPHGPPCGCGSRGCLEQFASGTAIARMAAPYYGDITAKEVAQAAHRGEPLARHVFAQAGFYLGIACANFANLFNPQCIVIGGGVAHAFDLFIASMQAAMRQRTFVEVYDNLRIVPATCGTDAGGLGAARQAMTNAECRMRNAE